MQYIVEPPYFKPLNCGHLSITATCSSSHLNTHVYKLTPEIWPPRPIISVPRVAVIEGFHCNYYVGYMAVTGYSAHDQCMHDVNEWTDNWHIKDLQVVTVHSTVHEIIWNVATWADASTVHTFHNIVYVHVPTFAFSVAPVQP